MAAYALKQDNGRSKRSYISTQAFNTSVYSYVTSLNPTTFKQEGKLVLLTTTPAGVALSATTCPAGHILREVGRKLYPGVNPGLLANDTYQGAVNQTTDVNNKVWVRVFDAITGLVGYIDSNSSVFSIYSTDKVNDIVDVRETDGLSLINRDIVTGGQLRSSSITTNSTATGGTLTINPQLGQVFRFTATMASAVTLAATAGSAAAAPGAIVYVIFTNGGGQTIVGDQTTVLGAASATMTNAKTYSVTLVSNGVTFVQTSAVQGF